MGSCEVGAPLGLFLPGWVFCSWTFVAAHTKTPTPPTEGGMGHPRWTGTVHPDLASGFRPGGSSEQDDAGYEDPPEDEDGSRCRRTPSDGAVKLSRVVTEEHGWDKCE